MTLNACLNGFRSVKHLNGAFSWNVWDILTALFPVLHVFSWCPRWKYLLKTPGNGISKTLSLKMSLDASALRSLCLWCELNQIKPPTIHYQPATYKLFDSPAWWNDFTTTTRILYVLSFMFEFGNPSKVNNKSSSLHQESKTLKDSGCHSKMMSLCQWSIVLTSAQENYEHIPIVGMKGG